MVDTDATGATEEPTAACAVCGTPVDTGEWHPVAATKPTDERPRIVAFCSPDCREDWVSAEATRQEHQTNP